MAAPPLSSVCTAAPARDAVAEPSGEEAYAGSAAVPTSPLAAATTTTFAQIERSRRFCDRLLFEDRYAKRALAGRALLSRRELGAIGLLPRSRSASSLNRGDAESPRLAHGSGHVRCGELVYPVSGKKPTRFRDARTRVSRVETRKRPLQPYGSIAVASPQIAAGREARRVPVAGRSRPQTCSSLPHTAFRRGTRTQEGIPSSRWEYPVMVCARYQIVTFCGEPSTQVATYAAHYGSARQLLWQTSGRNMDPQRNHTRRTTGAHTQPQQRDRRNRSRNIHHIRSRERLDDRFGQPKAAP
jgi:hypothetical protein